MIKNDLEITSMMYGDVVKQIAEQKGIGLTEARMELAQMSFSQYNALINEANITPPSGNTIGPASQSSMQKQPQAAKGPSQVKAIWPGSGAPLEVGMTVGLKDKTGKPVPGQVSQVDMGANGVKVKNPTTGQDEWMNTDTLEPFMAGQEQPPGTPTQEDNDLMRLQELAGITKKPEGPEPGSYAHDFNTWQRDAQAAGLKIVKQPQDETGNMTQNFQALDKSGQVVGYFDGQQGSGIISRNPAEYKSKISPKGLSAYNNDQYQKAVDAYYFEDCSGGATGAGAVAIAPTSMGRVKRRQETTESPKKEYTPKAAAKTIVGDTKPSQASGELSATLAANGRKTASRTNNGFKK